MAFQVTAVFRVQKLLYNNFKIDDTDVNLIENWISNTGKNPKTINLIQWFKDSSDILD